MGQNVVVSLKERGVQAKQDVLAKVSVFDIVIPTEGPLAHPRASDPIEESFLTNENSTGIMDLGRVEKPVLVWRKGVVDGKLVLELIAGSRRTNGLIEAVRRWKAADTFKPGMEFIPVRFFSGDEKAAWKARLLENSDPDKKPDSWRVLCVSVQQMSRLGMTEAEILSTMPRNVTRQVLDAMLRSADLTTEAQAAFDAGAPIALLPAVLDAPRERQVETANKLVEAGATTPQKAARVVNKEARASGRKAPRPFTPKQIRALTVGAGKLGLDDEKTVVECFNDDPTSVAVEEIIHAAQADGFAMFGKLVTGEIKVDDLPAHLRAMANQILKK